LVSVAAEPSGSLGVLVPPADNALLSLNKRQIRSYRTFQAQFDHRRRKLKLDFARLFDLFASDLSIAQIAQRAGVSRVRLNAIYDRYFAELFGASARERQRSREQARREKVAARLQRVVSRDRVISAIKASAARAKPSRTVEPIIVRMDGEVTRHYRHRAVLIDGRDSEPVHHLRNSHSGERGLTYATTTLYRSHLARARWAIFFIDVQGFRRRLIRSPTRALLRRLFADGQTRVSIYIPLDGRPSNPRYDFLQDEDRWS
jgi:AraC-like DNA-binding protein